MIVSKNILEKIAFTLLIFFSFIGMFIVGVVIHEYSHYQDYKDQVATQEICALSLPTNTKSFSLDMSLGSYNYNYSPKNQENINQIDKYTEIKAYFLNFLLFLAFDICLSIVLINRVKLNKKFQEASL